MPRFARDTNGCLKPEPDAYETMTAIRDHDMEAQRLISRISELVKQREEQEQLLTKQVHALRSIFQARSIPANEPVMLHDWAYWLDDSGDLQYAPLRSWTELAQSPATEPKAPSLPACAAPHCLNVVMLGEVYCEKHWPDGVFVKAPELTTEQETEAAAFMAMDTILHTDADEDLDTIERELAAAYHLPVDAPRHLIAGEVS